MDIVELRQILSIINSYTQGQYSKSRKFIFSASGKIRTFAEGLISGKIRTDADAALLLTGSSEKSQNYRKLKSRLSQWALKRFLLLEGHKTHMEESRAAICQLSYLQAAYRLLYSHGLQQIAHKVVVDTLASADEFGHTIIKIECLSNLRRDAALAGDLATLKSINAEIETTFRLLHAEYNSKGGLDLAMAWHAKTDLPKTEVLPELEKHLEEAGKNREFGESPELTQNYFQLRIVTLQISGRNREIISTCDELLGWYNENPKFGPPWIISKIKFYQAVAYYALAEPSKGIPIIEDALAPLKRFTHSSLKLREYAFLLYMQAGNYNQADCVFRQVLGYYRNSGKNDSDYQKWLVYEVYLRIVNQDSRKSRLSLLVEGHYNSEKFLRMVPDYKHDKAGFYVSILVAQVYLLIEEFIETQSAIKMDEIMNRSSALGQYLIKHLRPNRAFGSQCIIRAIIEIIRVEFCGVISKSCG